MENFHGWNIAPLRTPYTTSYASDIVLLSTHLSGKQPVASEPHSESDTRMKVLTRISTLLAIGNSYNPKAENVNAVVGRITADSVECLVFSENTRQDMKEVESHKIYLKQMTRAKNEKFRKRQRDLERGRPDTVGDRNSIQGTAQSSELADTIVPNAVRGRDLLLKWEQDGKQYVVQIS